MTDEQAAAAPDAPQVMEIGSNKTVRVTVDVGESEEKPAVRWTSTGSVLIEQNPEDPTSAKVYANIAGLGTVRAAVDFAGKHVEMVKEVMVTEPSIVPSNKIEFE